VRKCFVLASAGFYVTFTHHSYYFYGPAVYVLELFWKVNYCQSRNIGTVMMNWLQICQL